jgi:hypothetical protein
MIHGISIDQKTATISLKAVISKNGPDECTGCYFEAYGKCDKTFCTPEERKDGKTIIWKAEKVTK